MSEKQKQCSNVWISVLSILILIFTGTGYADDSIVKKKIFSVSRYSLTDDIEVIDQCNGKFSVSFLFKRTNQLYGVKEFTVIDSQNVRYNAVFEEKDAECGVLYVDKDLYSCSIAVNLPKKKSVVFQTFSIVMNDANNQELDKNIGGMMSEFDVALIDSQSNIGYDVLELKNHSSKDISIEKITAGESLKILDVDNFPKILKGNETYKIKLQSKSQGPQSITDFVEIKYVVNPNSLEADEKEEVKSVVEIKYLFPNAKVAVSSLGVDTNWLILKSLSPRFDSSFTLTPRSAHTLTYQVKNNGNSPVSLAIGRFHKPIYRDHAVDSDCGDSLASHKSCNVKLLVYPTKVEDIKQTLSVSSDVLQKSLEEELYIPVKGNNSSPVTITPMSVGDDLQFKPGGSIYNVVTTCSDEKYCRHCLYNVPTDFAGDDFTLLSKYHGLVAPIPELGYVGQAQLIVSVKPMQLRYQLENTSNVDFGDISGRIATATSDQDPAFKIGSECGSLKAGQKCEITVDFDPKKLSFWDSTKSVHRELCINFREQEQGQWWWQKSNGRKSEVCIPILIDKV